MSAIALKVVGLAPRVGKASGQSSTARPLELLEKVHRRSSYTIYSGVSHSHTRLWTPGLNMDLEVG